MREVFELGDSASRASMTGGGDIAMDRLHKPGEDNRPAGEYVEVGPRGGAVPHPRSVTIDRGDRLPPTREKGRKWVRKG